MENLSKEELIQRVKDLEAQVKSKEHDILVMTNQAEMAGRLTDLFIEMHKDKTREADGKIERLEWLLDHCTCDIDDRGYWQEHNRKMTALLEEKMKSAKIP